jgi:hypothetical protein
MPPEAGLNLNPDFYQSDEQDSQVGSWAFTSSFVQTELDSSVFQERGSLLYGQQVLVVPGRDSPPSRLGTLSQWRGENTSLWIPENLPEML